MQVEQVEGCYAMQGHFACTSQSCIVQCCAHTLPWVCSRHCGASSCAGQLLGVGEAAGQGQNAVGALQVLHRQYWLIDGCLVADMLEQAAKEKREMRGTMLQGPVGLGVA